MSRGWRHGVVALGCLGLALLPSPGAGQSGETAGVITELKIGRGRVELKRGAESDWRPAAPLQALRVGDALRATEDASAVVVLSGGRASVRVDAASPFLLSQRAAEDTKLQKAWALLDGSISFLTAGGKESRPATLGTRGGSRPPVIVSPRNGLVLPESLTFEWTGSRVSRVTLRIVGPSGVILEQTGVTGPKFAYPPDAPKLAPGVRYTFQVITGGHPPHEAWFELLDAGRAEAVRADLTTLEQAAGPMPASSLATVRAGYLARSGLAHDARLQLVATLAKDPDEPTLHLLLGHLYRDTDLPGLAAEEYAKAQYLLRAPPTQKGKD